MDNRRTEKMVSQLKSAKDFDQFSQEHEDDFLSAPLSGYIQALIRQKSLVKADVIKAADLDRVYGYQIISGKRIPTRDKLIQLAFGLQLDLQETQVVLKIASHAPLYARVKRDAAIIFCLNRGYGFMETQSFLQQANMRIIGE